MEDLLVFLIIIIIVIIAYKFKKLIQDDEKNR